MKTRLAALILILPFVSHAQEPRCDAPNTECASRAVAEDLWPQEWRDGTPPVKNVSREPVSLCVVLCAATGPRIEESCQSTSIGDDISVAEQLCVMKIKTEASACKAECREDSRTVRR